MAGRFVTPFSQFLDSTPEVRSGAQLFFYAAGTSTKLNTYSDRNLTSPNTNPVVLNSAGYPAVDIYLQDLDYKVVLAPSTDSDPPSSPIWTADYVNARDSKLIAKTLTGSGSPNGAVAGTAGSSSILPDFYWDFTNSILYVCTTTGTSSTAVWTAVNASTAASVTPLPGGYLTPTSGTAIITTDVTAGTSFYYTPFRSNVVPIYNGSSFSPIVFSELTLTLTASQVANSIYDVFVFSNSGVLTLVVGPAWSVVTAGSGARGTGASTTQLTLVNGIYVNAVQMSAKNGASTYTVGANLATYVGSVLIDGTNGQISLTRTWGQSRRWALWNAYNRVPICMAAGNSSATFTTANFTPHQVSANDTAVTLCGLAEEIISVSYFQAIAVAAPATDQANFGIGWNSTSAYSGQRALFNSSAANSYSGLGANYVSPPTLGRNDANLLIAATGTQITFSGNQNNMQLLVTYRG